ncbi:hypothetical protein ACLMJK_002190 [Lecanora helva]
MAPISNDDQFKFLISCIRYSDNGKINFDSVAEECGIVSKGAAAKRYERLMKAHGIHQSQISIVESIRNAPVGSRTKASSAKGPSKKRKANPPTETDVNTDDDEGLSNAKAKGTDTKVKTERRGKKIKTEPESYKSEPSDDGDDSAKVKEESKDSSPPYDSLDSKPRSAIPQYDGADDSPLMRDFLAFGAHGEKDKKLNVLDAIPTNLSSAMDAPAAIKGEQGIQESILIAD